MSSGLTVAHLDRARPPGEAGPGEGPHEFLQLNDDGTPVSFDPCRPVHWVINPVGAPPGGEEKVRAAFDRVAEATGLELVFEGTTTETWDKQRKPYQPELYGDRWAPVLVSWSTEAVDPQLADYVTGVGGGNPVGFVGETSTYVSGSLLLDAADLATVAELEGPGSQIVLTTAMHELGHVVGLGHVADPGEVMYSESTIDQPSDWGPGDRAGLRQLGDGVCRPDL